MLPTSLWPLDEAIQRVHALGRPSGTERILVRAALGRTLADSVHAAVAIPPFPRAMMDGYAVRAADTTSPRPLAVVDTLAAGAWSTTRVGQGEAVRIMTGAPVPEGADAVVRFEWCDASDGKHVTVRRPVAPGESIQPRGEDCEVGSHLLPAGTLLRHAEVALLCAAGVAEVDVFTTPKVAVVVTGSELVPQPSTPLGKGQIYACNDLLVAAMVESCGAVVAAVEYVADQLESVQAAIRRAAETADCVITTGGASVGDFDCVPQALRQLGATVHMEKVWMRPGTPFVAASLGNTPVFGLSGNPAACSIQAEVLVRAFFDGCCGRAPNPFPWTGILKDDIVLSPVKHTRVLRARALSANGQLLVDASLAQSPGVLRSLVSANCLIRVPGGGAERGSEVPLRWLW